ncbi:MAG: putative addiction module component (TIGR02574 family) [Phenylobacterium sp.]|jgi:putative addiction module component (TIGR02574 family)
MVNIMAHVNKSIVNDVLSLPSAARIELVELLLSSLDTPDKKIDAIWASEAESRLDAYDAGNLKAVPLETVLAKYRT